MIPETSFYSPGELSRLGLGSYGHNVFISRRASVYNPQMIHVGNHVRIDDFCILSAGKEIRFGSYVHMGAYAAIYGVEGVILEDFSGISARVTIYTVSDDYSGETLTNPMVPERLRTRCDHGAVCLKRHAIVGANSIIMPGVTIGEGAAIGAMSFVTKECDPWMIYFGVPAKKMRRRSQKLLESESLLLDTKHKEETRGPSA